MQLVLVSGVPDQMDIFISTFVAPLASKLMMVLVSC